MKFEPPHNVVVVVDGPDPDNFACILAATCKFFGLHVVAIIMTGRPVCVAQGARPYDFTPNASRAVNRDNALHAKGILLRHGREPIPVFEGDWASYSTIDQSRHIHERVTDVYDDAHAGYEIRGDIKDAIRYLADIPGTLHFVFGGPMTDMRQLMYQPMLEGKFGILTAQLGMFGSPGITMLGGGRRQFNATADPKSTHDTLFDYAGPIYLVPSDITKLQAHEFASVEEIERLVKSEAMREIALMYRQAWPDMWGKLGIPAHIHDFHPAELMSYLLHGGAWHHENFLSDGDAIGRYHVRPVGIGKVPYLPHERGRWGEIDLAPYSPGMPLRFLTDGVDTSRHRKILGRALNSPAFVSPRLRELVRR